MKADSVHPTQHTAATNIYCLLFEDYETLDLMGPVELLYHCPNTVLHYVSQTGGPVRSKQGFAIETHTLATLAANSVLLIPGGQGARQLVQHQAFWADLAQWVKQAETCLAVCTGSALLAAAGCLTDRKATSNKRAFAWVQSVDPAVDWQRAARWVHDGKFYTSSGVSAGMDMALGFIADRFGLKQAQEIARHTEYRWQNSPQADEFAMLYGD